MYVDIDDINPKTLRNYLHEVEAYTVESVNVKTSSRVEAVGNIRNPIALICMLIYIFNKVSPGLFFVQSPELCQPSQGEEGKGGSCSTGKERSPAVTSQPGRQYSCRSRSRRKEEKSHEIHVH